MAWMCESVEVGISLVNVRLSHVGAASRVREICCDRLCAAIFVIGHSTEISRGS